MSICLAWIQLYFPFLSCLLLNRVKLTTTKDILGVFETRRYRYLRLFHRLYILVYIIYNNRESTGHDVSATEMEDS